MRSLGFALVSLLLTACTALPGAPCVRHSDCRAPETCGAAGVCEIALDAGTAPETPDATDFPASPPDAEGTEDPFGEPADAGPAPDADF